MKDFTIIADGTCDLGEDLQKEYNIRVLMGFITTPDGKEMVAPINWDVFSRDDFYKGLKANPSGYSTAPCNVAGFEKAFIEEIENGKDVICMTISSGLSGCYDFACQGRDLALEKYPDANIVCIDSLRFGPGFGLIAIEAANLRNRGKSLKEVADYVEANKNRFHQAGWLDDLSFVAKKGRLTHAKAFFGTLAGVKPIGEFDYNGLTTIIGKAKGAKSAYAVLLQYLEQTIENPEDQIIFIAQTNRYEQAVEYKKLIEEKFKPKAVIIKDVFPSCGINVGPGLMAAYYYGKPISQGLEEERAIMEGILNAGK